MDANVPFFVCFCFVLFIIFHVYCILVYTTQMNSTFHARRLASSQVINQMLFTSEQPKKYLMAFVGILPQIKFPFGPLVIQLVWYILKQLLTSVSVKVGDSCIALHCIIVLYHYLVSEIISTTGTPNTFSVIKKCSVVYHCPCLF